MRYCFHKEDISILAAPKSASWELGKDSQKLLCAFISVAAFNALLCSVGLPEGVENVTSPRDTPALAAGQYVFLTQHCKALSVQHTLI